MPESSHWHGTGAAVGPKCLVISESLLLRLLDIPQSAGEGVRKDYITCQSAAALWELGSMGRLRGILVRLHGARALTSRHDGAAASTQLVALPPVLGTQTQVAHFSASPAARAAERNYSAGLPPLDPSLLRPRTPPINYGIRIVPEKTAFVVWHLLLSVQFWTKRSMLRRKCPRRLLQLPACRRWSGLGGT